MGWKITPVFLLSLISIAQSTQDDNLLESSSVSTILDEPGNVAEAVNEFGYKLTLAMLNDTEDGQNIVMSPTSVASLLAMTLLGTVGKTHEELAAALGFSQDIIESRRNHEHFGELLRSLNTNTSSSKTLYADAVFVDIHSKVRGLYGDYLRRVYNGDALGVDFAHAAEVKDVINQWVDSHTEGKIEKFLDDELPTSTKAVLLSALYFRGQWQTPFLEGQTQKANFTTPSDTTVLADLMMNVGNFKYIHSVEDDFHMIALPYNDSTTTLYALKPQGPLRRRVPLRELMMRITYSKINQAIDKMQNNVCIIKIPKMDLKIKAELGNPLKSLGVESLFSPGQANFALMFDSNTVTNTSEEILSRITEGNETQVAGDARGVKEMLRDLPNPGIHVDSVIHDVKLMINEYGTEAVAATSGVLARTAKMFVANSPFYIFIRNEKTKLITFSAVINDPTT